MTASPSWELLSEAVAQGDSSLIALFRAGDPVAIEQLDACSASRLSSLALVSGVAWLSRRIDAGHIVQSDFRRFLEASRAGKYQTPSGYDLWQLLLVVTLARLHNKLVHQHATKRDLRRNIVLEVTDQDCILPTLPQL